MSNERSLDQQLSGFFNAVQDAEGNYDKVYLADDFAALLRSMFSDGIFRESGDPQYENSAFQVWPSLLDQTFLSVWQGRMMIKGYWFDNPFFELDMSSYMNQPIEKTVEIRIKLDLNLREFEIFAEEGPVEDRENEYLIYTADIPANSTSTQEFTLSDGRGIYCPWVRSIADQDPAIYDNVPIIDGYPLVERGENENGSWEKWWDGTLICGHKIQANVATVPLGSIDGTNTQRFTFPVEFIEPPDVIPFASFDNSTTTAWGSLTISNSTTECGVQLITYAPSSVQSITRGYKAKGKWK